MIAVDLGSNTIRFIQYDGAQWGKSFEKIVKTAESLHETGVIGDNAILRVINAIEEARKYFNFTDENVLAYTTAAVRMARNGLEVLDRIEQETGIGFKMIDGEKEARLTLLAVQNRLKNLGMVADDFLLADIGGGSTELIVVNTDQIHSISLPVGIVTMSEQAKDENELNYLLLNFKHQIQNYLAHKKIAGLVLTAGTPTTIAAYLLGMDYASYDPQRINGTRLALHECHRVYDELLAMDEDLRSRYVGVGRELLIVTGIRIVETLFEAVELESAIIVDDGLREGIALEYFLS